MPSLKERRLIKYCNSLDSYAQPVSMTFEQNRVIPNPFGGCLTVIYWILTIFWFSNAAMQLIICDWTVLNYDISGVTDGRSNQFFVDQNAFLPAFYFMDYSGTDSQETIYKNIQAYYEQVDNNQSTIFKAVPCEDTPFYEGNLKDHFNPNIYYCPDLGDDQFKFMREPGQNGLMVRLKVGYCEYLTTETGTTDCNSASDAYQVVDNYYVVLNQLTEIPNGDLYIDKSVKQTYASHNYEQFLRNDIYQIFNQYLTPIQAVYETNWAFGWGGVVTSTNFMVDGIQPPLQKKNLILDTLLLEFKFQLDDTILDEIWKRNNLMYYFITYGGIISFFEITFVALYSGQANFNADNLMANYLYTTEKDPDENTQQPSTEGQDTSPNYQTRSGTKLEEINNADAILRRKPFWYPTGSAFLDHIKTYPCCLMCGCCRCCKQSRMSRLFEKAQSQLYSETDMVSIVKMLRLHSFLLKHSMEPYQRALVKYFRQFCIEDETKARDISALFVDKTNIPETSDPSNIDPVVQDLLDHQNSMISAYNQDKTIEEELQFSDFYKQSIQYTDLIQIVKNFRPESKPIDMFALKSIFGEHVDPEKIPFIRTEFMYMLEGAHNDLKDMENNSQFLKSLFSHKEAQKNVHKSHSSHRKSAKKVQETNNVEARMTESKQRPSLIQPPTNNQDTTFQNVDIEKRDSLMNGVAQNDSLIGDQQTPISVQDETHPNLGSQILGDLQVENQPTNTISDSTENNTNDLKDNESKEPLLKAYQEESEQEQPNLSINN